MLGKLRNRIAAASLACMCWCSVARAESLQVGDQGSDVAEVQAELVRIGYDVVPDGDFGPATVEAVKYFQAAHGMDADGTVGPATYEALLGKAMPETISRGSNYVSRRLVQTAMAYIGVPYAFGGTSPSGFDCSGFVRFVFANAGIYLPRAADEQYEVGHPIPTSGLRTGDLVFFSTYEYGPSHVGIYLSDGNFIHAASSIGVSIASIYDEYYWGDRYIGARRIL